MSELITYREESEWSELITADIIFERIEFVDYLQAEQVD